MGLASACVVGAWLILALLGSLTASQDELTLSLTERSFLLSSSEKTSNAIPEAEGTLGAVKKYGLEKSEIGPVPDQLEKPYPYLKSAGDRLDNTIHQSKRSSLLTVNGSLPVSVSENPGTGASLSTEAETISTESSTESSTVTTSEASTTLETTLEPQTASSELETETPAATTPPESSLATTPPESSLATTPPGSSLATTPPGRSLATTPPGRSFATTPPESSVATTPPESSLATTLPGNSLATTPPESSIGTTPPESSIGTTITGSTTFATSTPTDIKSSSQVSRREVAESSTAATDTLQENSSQATTLEEQTTMATSTTITEQTVPILTSVEPRSVGTTPISKPTTLQSTAPSASTTTTSSKTLPMTTSSPTPSSTSNSEPYSLITWQEEGTTETISPTVPSEDVTILIRIVFEGTWHDVCSKLPTLRQSLADLVNSSVDKSISPSQIVFHQTQCSENLSATSLMSEVVLTSVLVYVVDENGSFDGTLTKILPSLYERTPIEFPLTIHSFVLVQEADSGNAIAVVIVSCVAFICLILLAGLLFIMRKRQGRFNYGERCRPVSLDAYSLDSVSAYNSVRRSKGVLRSSKRSYGNPTFEDSSAIPSHPLNFGGLSSFCGDANAIAEEFVSIPQVSSKIDELPPGAEVKNRYANVIPLPETRVPLQRLNNDPLTEYINASYVRGPKNANKYYIACQAPTESTVSDFWRMLWEQQSKVIIMLTDLVENGVEKCTEYIPPLEVSDCHRLYGDFQVTLKKREAKEKYAISTLHLKNLENNTFREVSHIWYLWPANGVPTDGTGLIAVLLEARALQRGAAGPIVVHCSPGTGRTGTLIAIDLGIRQYEVTRTVDVPRVVYTIRRDRAGAVQTREQYTFIYKALNLYASKLAGGAIDST